MKKPRRKVVFLMQDSLDDCHMYYFEWQARQYVYDMTHDGENYWGDGCYNEYTIERYTIMI